MAEYQFERSLALVGVGYWGKNLARNFHSLGVLHTICDTNPDLLQQNQERYPDVKLSSDFSATLRDPAIKRIVIAAPARLHYELACQALRAKKDVFVEKPLCLTVAESEKLVQLASDQDCIVMVGHILHYHPCVQSLQEMIGRGELGKIQYITSNRLNLGSIRTEENALWNFAPHDISVILSLLGQRMPEEVRCVGTDCVSPGVADMSLTTLRFGDVRAHIYVSWLNPFKEQRLVVVGSAGLAVFDDTKPWTDKLQVHRNHVQWPDGKTPIVNPNEMEHVEVVQKEPLKEECLHFLQCCEDRKTPLTDGQEGLRVMRILEAAQQSMDAHGEAKRPAMLQSGPSTFVHPTAVVDPEAKIGPGTKIWHFSHVMADAQIGPECNIGQNVVISPGVRLGKNVKVQNNVSLYTGLQCEDNVFIGPSAVFTNVINPRSAVSRKTEYKATVLREGATIGANATVICGIEIGAYAFIGAGAVVTKNVKSFALVYGNPAKQVGWMSKHGDRLDLPVSIGEGSSQICICVATGEQYELCGAQLSVCAFDPLVV